MMPVALPAPPPFRFSCTLSVNFKFNHHSSGRINKIIMYTPNATTPATVPPSYYRIIAPLSKRKQSVREVTKERERQRKIRKIQEERGWESSSEEEDITAIGLLQRTWSADSVSASDESDNSESEDDEMLVSEEEELEEVDESAFEKFMKSALEHCVDRLL